MRQSIEFLYTQGQEKIDQRCLEVLYTPPMEMGEWVKRVREAAGLTQTQLGERLGVTKGNVSGWENGRHEPSYWQVLRMAELVNWKVAPPSLPPEAFPQAAGGELEASSWPFGFSKARFDALPAAQREKIENIVLGMILAWESDQEAKKRESA